MVPCKSTAEKVSFEWSQQRILLTDSKFRTTWFFFTFFVKSMLKYPEINQFLKRNKSPQLWSDLALFGNESAGNWNSWVLFRPSPSTNRDTRRQFWYTKHTAQSLGVLSSVKPGPYWRHRERLPENVFSRQPQPRLRADTRARERAKRLGCKNKDITDHPRELNPGKLAQRLSTLSGHDVAWHCVFICLRRKDRQRDLSE